MYTQKYTWVPTLHTLVPVALSLPSTSFPPSDTIISSIYARAFFLFCFYSLCHSLLHLPPSLTIHILFVCFLLSFVFLIFFYYFFPLTNTLYSTPLSLNLSFFTSLSVVFRSFSLIYSTPTLSFSRSLFLLYNPLRFFSSSSCSSAYTLCPAWCYQLGQ